MQAENDQQFDVGVNAEAPVSEQRYGTHEDRSNDENAQRSETNRDGSAPPTEEDGTQR